MATKRLVERVVAPLAGTRVNREAGSIAGVLICGTKSANRRDYPPAVFRRDYAKYEGRPVNCDHGREATVDRRLGWFSGVTVGEDGRPRGTLNLLKSHPLYERVMEAAERNPALYGLSHVAHCRTNTVGGREVVESIEAVESIDLVAEPATVTSLFESNRSKGNRVALTVKALCEALVKHPKTTAAQVAPLKRLGEMDGMDDMAAGLDAPPPDDADPADGVKDAFQAAISHIVEQAMSGDMDPKEALGKIKKLLASHGEVNGTAPDAGDDADPAEPADDAAEESKKRKGESAGLSELREAQAACEAAGFKAATLADLTIVAAVPAAERPALVARLARTVEGAGAEKVTAAGRRPGAGGAGAAKVAESVPADAKSFAASIRE